MKYFRAYLLGHHCVVLTDLLHTTNPSAKLALWAMIIQEMDLEIKHRPGKTNYSADTLSRNPVPDATVAVVQAVSSNFIAEQSSDAELKVFIDYVRDRKLPEDGIVLQGKYFDIVDGIVHHENPLYPGRWCAVAPGKRRERFD